LIKFKPVRTVINYLNEVKIELSKVIWPKKEEVVKLTLVVIIVSSVVAAYLGLLDYGLTKLLELLVNK
jgi:preprotein translocase subunit SecE